MVHVKMVSSWFSLVKSTEFKKEKNYLSSYVFTFMKPCFRAAKNLYFKKIFTSKGFFARISINLSCDRAFTWRPRLKKVTYIFFGEGEFAI